MTLDELRAQSIAPWLADLERALGRDASHAVVVVAPGSQKSLLLRSFPEHVAPRLRAAAVSLGGLADDAVCAAILAALGQTDTGNAQAQLLAMARDLASQGSGLALLLEDASLLSPETLGRLRGLALAARPGLRLAFCIPPAGAAGHAHASAVVEAFGLGAQKLIVDDAVERPGCARVPSVPPGAISRPQETLGPSTRPAHARRRVSAGGMLALAAALFVTGGLRGGDSAQDVAAPPPPERGSARVQTAALLPTRASAPAPDPPRRVPGPALDASRRAPVAQVAVNLNARPWARIEVDGRDVGPTPIAGLRLAAGEHAFRARLPDGRVLERRLRIDAYRNRVTFP